MLRAAVLLLTLAVASPAWVESVEFPWTACPRPLWESQLVWLKNIGVTHVSLPQADATHDAGLLTELIQIIRRLNMEADLEGPVPESMQSFARAHGGPLTDPLPGSPVRISVLAPTAVTRVREVLTSGTSAVIWTDVEETLGPEGYRPGAISFTGEEKPAALALRRSAQLSLYWNKTFPGLHATPGAGTVVNGTGAPSSPGPGVRQFAAENGTSVVSVVNKSARIWSGDLRVLDPQSKQMVNVPGVSVPAHDALWLPVNVPLTAGPLCKDCSAFANSDHLVYATAELTTMEYENGILAMEFAAPSQGEVILQLSREPSGPLVAGGRPAEFDWDEHTMRARLKIPRGAGPGNHTRIGLAIEAPDATAFFSSARVLMIGEANRLTAEFSSDAIAQRSRLRTAPAFPMDVEPAKEPLLLTWVIKVPETAVNGDHADLAIEADGMQMSHVRPQLLRSVEVRFPDAVDVHLTAGSALPLFPATVPVNQRTGRDLTVTVRNNAPEIRNFVIEPKGEGVEFSPEKLEVTVGVSTSRDVSFRVFARGAMPGLHAGTVTVSGAAATTVPVQFVVIPQSGAVAYSASGFFFIESAKTRASFFPGRWLEFLNKDNGQNLLGSTGVAFTAGPIEAREDSLVFSDKSVKLDDLELLAAKAKK
jgi:hypothetical protein